MSRLSLSQALAKGALRPPHAAVGKLALGPCLRAEDVSEPCCGTAHPETSAGQYGWHVPDQNVGEVGRGGFGGLRSLFFVFFNKHVTFMITSNDEVLSWVERGSV